jgi:DNA-binding transcriptional LysR family regulator
MMSRSPNMPTDLLRTFVTVIDLGGHTRAADALGRSQPAISLQIKRLEQLVDAKLIVQRGRNFTLTEDGEILAVYARQILRLNDEAMGKFRSTEASGAIRVGLPTDYAVTYLQSMLTQLARTEPDIELEIYCDLSRSLHDALHSDDVDIIVAHTRPGASQYLVRSWREQPIWVTSATGECHLANPIPLATHPDGCEYRNRMVQALTRSEHPWRIAFTSPGIKALQQAVVDGLGVSVMTGKTCIEGMRILDDGDGYPRLDEIKVGLYYKHPRLSQAGLVVVNRLISALDEAAARTEAAA